MRRRRNFGERGTSLVEFALVLPLVAVVSFGIVDTGRAYQLQNRLKNAAREGASFAQFNPKRSAQACATAGQTNDVVDKVLEEDSTLNLAAADVTVLHNNAGYASTCNEAFAAGDTITVKVTRQLKILTPLVSSLTGSSITLTGRDEVQVQQ